MGFFTELFYHCSNTKCTFSLGQLYYLHVIITVSLYFKIPNIDYLYRLLALNANPLEDMCVVHEECTLCNMMWTV